METYLNKYLSGIELYLGIKKSNDERNVFVFGDELHHIVNVMRHRNNDIIHITDGEGSIYKAKITEISKPELKAEIIGIYRYENINKNLTFCLPLLKNSDRLEFALEKCIEFGITNFLFFRSKNCVMKSFKEERFTKIAVSAMKQTLRSFIPSIKFTDNVKNILQFEGTKILFLQEAENKFSAEVIKNKEVVPIYLLFGPEGGFSSDEIELFNKNGKYRLTQNRLRSESAIILTASAFSLL